MLKREDHAVEEGSCWWGRIMLVEKDHVSGRGSCWFCKMMRNAKMWFSHQKNPKKNENSIWFSIWLVGGRWRDEDTCWWGRIMLVGKDHAGSARWWGMQKCDFRFKKSTFSQNGLLFVRSQHKSQQTICLLAAHLFQLKILRAKGSM